MKMEAYTEFAAVYDTFMDNTPYEVWCGMLEQWIQKYGISVPNQKKEDLLASERNLVVDLGCGTGTLTEMLSEKGYHMIGVDMSEAMLQIAMQKKEQNGSQVLYLQQDMRDLDLYSTAGTVISVCDSLNYILEEEELLEVFRKVNKFLYPGGIFLFDFNTVYKYETVIGDSTIAENREECSFIWENFYYPDEEINEYDITVFVREAGGAAAGRSTGDKDCYRKFNETHYQRGYTPGQVKGLLVKAGMKVEVILDADTQEECTGESERVFVVARECGKESK